MILVESIDKTNLPLPFVKPFGLTCGASVRGTMGLILVRKYFNCFNFYSILGKMYVPYGTYLIFLPSSNDINFFKNNTHLFSFYKTIMSINILPKLSSNDAIYFSSKNNTCLSFPSINNDVTYYPSKRKMISIMS